MTIRKKGNKYILLSKEGKKLGEFKTKSDAEKREKEVKFFKSGSKKIKT